VTTIQLVSLPGDGIGTEVVDAALAVLQAAGERFGFALAVEPVEAGAARYARTGVVYTEQDFALCRAADAILLGALGLPDVLKPDGTEAGPDLQFRLRFDLDLYAGVRPVERWPGVPGPLARSASWAVTIVRENTEGLYASRGGGTVVRETVATDTLVLTAAGVDRIVTWAFEWAAAHPPAAGQPKVTCVDKANVLRSYAFWRRRFDAVAARYAGRVEADHQYVDAFVAQLALAPETVHVAVAENMFGDIVSDLAGALVGSLGLAPSGDIGERHAVFQPAHGSAPTLAGKGVANPVATILSGAMLLEWLAPRKGAPELATAARAIHDAVGGALADPANRTADLGGRASTASCTAAVIAALPRP
jgi:3-isopropylmalate dehydrogenase